jgi:hypothetical protein
MLYAATTLALCWPMLAGRFLVNPMSDQYSAGYAFRAFGAEMFRSTGQIPEWNPYLFGGMPFIAAMHGDIFYPTAWLRWFLPVDTAMNLGFALHLLLAGVAMFALLRALRFGFGAALTGGAAYQLTGIVASLVHPGHDGKLFVSALAPLVFLALHRAIAGRSPSAYGALAILVGLCMLSPHYQLTYYLLVAAGLWTLWLVWRGPERPEGNRLVPLALALGAVLLGLAISAVQALPFLEYVPWSPRGEMGASQGWDYATSYSLPRAELLTAILPEFTGVVEQYWGVNPIKLHSEYLGAVVVALAALGWTERRRHPALLPFLGIGGLFLLIALGRHTPFYRLWYEAMPMMKSVRAPGMAFFLVALPVAVWAAAGAERVLRGNLGPRPIAVTFGALAALGLLGAAGALQPVAEAVADPARLSATIGNADALRGGGLRLLLVALVGGLAVWGIATRRLTGAVAAGALAAVTAGDLYLVDRGFFRFSPPARALYAPDAITRRLGATELPYRVLDAGAYPHSYLMGLHIPQVLGYHGNELHYFDDLLGGKNVWANLNAGPALWDQLAVRFVILPGEQPLPGFTRVEGPVPVTPGGTAVLYQRDSAPPWARVVPAAVKVPEAQIVPTVVDPRFPSDRVVLLPDTASVATAPVGDSLPAPSARQARVAHWAPGEMTLAIEGEDPRPAWLVVAENWYPDWHATVDGHPAAVHRGQGTLLAVELPGTAREVVLRFASASYRTGKLVSWAGLALALLAMGIPSLRARRRRG